MKSKVKISNVGKFANGDSPIYFDIILKKNKETFSGKLIIDRTKKLIRVNFGRPLEESKDEQLAVLKEIFYCFCITECRKKKNSTQEHIEEYIFIDENVKLANRRNVIDSIMQYDIFSFDQYIKKERMISYIKYAYDKIKQSKKMGITKLELNNLYDFSKKELEVYKKILLKYLKSKGYRGKLESKKVIYNENEVYGYCSFFYSYSYYKITYEITDYIRNLIFNNR